jgi:hypothetical protein
MQKWHALVSAAMVTAAIVPACAEGSPWCVKLDAFTKNCAFADYNECVAVANNATSLATGIGQCVRNPDYQPSADAAAHTKPVQRKTTNPQR